MLTGSLSSAGHFRTGSGLHLVSLLGCALVVWVFGLMGRRAVARGDGRRMRRLRWIAGFGGLAVWLGNAAYWSLAMPFSWENSLPLHFCNLANLISAVAVLGPWRLWKSVLYFWSVTLCVWAFLTPVLGGGYATLEFWVFWGYHLFIPLAVVETFVVQRFRPGLRDLRDAWLLTFCYLVLLVILDAIFGWTYGFVGPSKPSAPTLLDGLGAYPLRLLWMSLIASGLFLLAWLPWRKAT